MVGFAWSCTAEDKIRHAGLYSSTFRGGLLDQARTFVGACKKPKNKDRARYERLEKEYQTCPICGGALRRKPLPSATRAPPEDAPC